MDIFWIVGLALGAVLVVIIAASTSPIALALVLVILKALWVTAQFVGTAILFVFAIIAQALPWILRALSLAFFVASWVGAVVQTGMLYGAITDALGALFVSSAVGFALIALPLGALMRGINVWSAFVLAGMVGVTLAWAAPHLQFDPLLRLAARAVPVSLAASGLVYFAVTQKHRRTVSEHSTSADPRPEDVG